jgi:endonuclease/exonuclease/phosphatase family metal-dependent hydrolase
MIAWLAAWLTAMASLASPAHAQEKPLRVVTYNIQFGKAGLDKVINTLRSLDADLVALEEVDRGTARAGRVDQLLQLAGALSFHSAFAEHDTMPEGRTGVALLSRWLTRIDYVWFSPQFELVRCDAISSRASDHRPVRADLTLSR